MSTASAMVSRMPRRTIAWSSHKITLIMVVLLVSICIVGVRRCAQRHRQDHRGAARGRTHVEPAVHLFGALLEPEQAKRLGLAQRLGAQAPPQVRRAHV